MAMLRSFAVLGVALLLLDAPRLAVCQRGHGHGQEAAAHHHGHGHAHDHAEHAEEGHAGGEHTPAALRHEHDDPHEHDHEEEHAGGGHGHEAGRHEHDDHEHEDEAHGHDAHDHARDHALHKDEGHDWSGAYASAVGMSVISFVGVVFLGISGSTVVGGAVEYICLAFAGAVLVADALLHLLPHALEGADHDSMTVTGMAAVAGCFSLLILQELCEWHRHVHDHGIQAYGVANLAVEMLHNYVDGITIGLSWMVSQQAGLGSSLAVAVHELPQELGDFMVLRAAGFPVARLLAWNFAASLTCVAGVATAHFVGQEATHAVKRYLTAFTAGSFLTLALNMVIPQALASIQERHKGAAAARAKFVCLLIAGFAVWTLVRIGDLEGHDHGHDHGHDYGHAHGHHDGHGHHQGGAHHHEF